VLRGLAKDKSRRYQNAEEFRQDVEAAVAGRQPVARLPRVEEPTTVLFTGEEETPTSTVRQLAFDDRTHRGTTTRPPAAWIWAGVLCVVVVVLAVALWVVSLTTGGFGMNNRTIPGNLAYSDASSVVQALRDDGLQPIVHRESSAAVPKGEVIRTSPVGGSSVPKGSAVSIWVSTGPEQVVVPQLSGLTADEAEQAIRQAQLTPGSVTTQHSATVPENRVVGADAKQGSSIAIGTTVNLTVSDGQVDLPDLTQQTREQAQTTLDRLQLTGDFQPVSCDPAQAGLVVGQQQAPGAVPQQSTVNLQYCPAR
jgi:serine/threonine-protein kinase